MGEGFFQQPQVFTAVRRGGHGVWGVKGGEKNRSSVFFESNTTSALVKRFRLATTSCWIVQYWVYLLWTTYMQWRRLYTSKVSVSFCWGLLPEVYAMTAQPKTEPALTGQEETPNGSKKGARGRGRGRPRMNEEEERAQMSQISAEQKAISQKIVTEPLCEPF